MEVLYNFHNLHEIVKYEEIYERSYAGKSSSYLIEINPEILVCF